jgi:hypothetical protein
MIEWTDYFKYRVKLRKYNLEKIENILNYSTERYHDNITQRFVVVGKHEKKLVMIPYEKENDIIVPITIHATTRQQITFRIKSGRFKYE